MSDEVSGPARGHALSDALAPELVDVARECRGRTVYPLSYGQERLFGLTQSEPANPSDIVVKGYRLRFSGGRSRPLDVATLARALDALAARHEILRTTFRHLDGVPVQMVLNSPVIDFGCVDLRGLSAESREWQATRVATSETQTPFELGRRPVWRVRYLLLDDAEVVLLMVYHRLIIDGWSIAVIYKELAALYAAFESGRTLALSEPLQYGYFAVWQRQQVACGRLASQYAYWRHQLDGATWQVNLPARCSTSLRRPSAPAQIAFSLDAACLSALTALGNTDKATLFMTLLATFEVLLMRWSGQEQMLIGTLVAGRNQIEAEDAVGNFLNYLLLRADLSGDPSFRELLRRVRITAIDALAHQELPFELLLEDAAPEDRRVAHPIPVRFVLQNAPRDFVGTGGPQGVAEGDPVWAERDTSDFVLSLGIRPDQNGGSFEFNTELFDEETIEAMIADYRTLLERVTSDAERRLSELSGDIGPRVAVGP